MRFFLVIFSILVLDCGFAQEGNIYLKTFVKKDTIQLRWAPTTPEILKVGLQNGYTIERNGSDGLKTFEILPFNKRKSDFDLSDSTSKGLFDFIDEFLTLDAELTQMPFALISLGASTSRDLAVFSGVYFEDLTAGDDSYRYTIKLNKSELKSNSEEVSGKKLSQNLDFTKLEGTSRIDLKEVYLKWEAASLNADYGGYYIYKSQDGKLFNKLNETALFLFTSEYEKGKNIIDFVDTAVTEGNTYYYKVQPINHFADPGKVSNIAEVYIQKTLRGYCLIDTVKSDGFDRKIIVEYKGLENEQVAEYCLYRADKIDSTYEFIEKKVSSDWAFEFNFKADLLSGDRHYFKVGAVSVDGDTAFSYPYYHFSLDQEPPGVPTAFEGIIDSAGIAYLKWIKPVDTDLIGYRVFRSNTEEGEYFEVTRRLSMNETYQDTLFLGSLTNEVYYKVSAIDQNYNNGPQTAPILLMKPDTIAPVAGVFTKYNVSNEGVYLSWSNSNSTDLKNQFLLRTKGNETDTVLTFYNEFDTILDVTGKVGSEYAYTLLAIDKSGNKKSSKPIYIKYEIGYRSAPLIKEPVVNREQKYIELKWEAIEEDVYSIQIYRSKADGKFKLYKTIRENVTEFVDDDLSINNEYHYKIKVMYKSGISSKLSEKKSVIY